MAQLVGNLMVGNLLTDPEATSFISLVDADEYLWREQILTWDVAENTEREAALINASRWLALSLPWRADWLDQLTPEAVEPRLGWAAARLAVQALTVNLWAPDEVGKQAKRYKAGSVEVEYHAAGALRGAIAGGKRFAWVYPMLRGLLASAGQHDVVRR